MKFTEQDTFYISEYRVEQCYGGPEEGGWWYDWRDFQRVVEAVNGEDAAYARCRALNAAQREQDKADGKRERWSVIGSPDTEYHVERHPAEDQTTERPYYC